MTSQQKKNPTNADLLREIKELQAMQSAHDSRITQLEHWKIAEDAYKAALLQVRGDEQEKKNSNETDAKTEVYKQLGKVLGFIGLALAAYLAGKGIQ